MDAFWQFWDLHPQYIAFSFLFIGLVEMITGIATTTGRESGEREPGDFGFDPLGFAKGDAAKLERLKLNEVKNGRLAMWAAAGEILQGVTTDDGALGNLGSALQGNAF
jgi:light-harvesting complex I chlorophyll a/b binding protein 1